MYYPGTGAKVGGIVQLYFCIADLTVEIPNACLVVTLEFDSPGISLIEWGHEGTIYPRVP